MLRTALGPAIAAFLEDPSIVEVMLNPDGRLWIDRLSSGLADTGERLSAADGERIVRLVAHHVGAKSMPARRASPPSCRKRESVSKDFFRRASRPRRSRSANLRSRSSP